MPLSNLRFPSIRTLDWERWRGFRWHTENILLFHLALSFDPCILEGVAFFFEQCKHLCFALPIEEIERFLQFARFESTQEFSSTHIIFLLKAFQAGTRQLEAVFDIV